VSAAQRRRTAAPAQQRPQQQPQRFWGWHRLEPDWADRLVRQADIRRGELVLDLGAGDGALTAPLVAAGARVLAVELHPARARRLRERFADEDVRVLEIDLLTLRLPERRFRVLSNPPWSLAKPLIRQLTGPASALTRADLVLQRGLVSDLGRRGTVGPGHRSRYATSYAMPIPRAAFRPAPPAPAGLLQIARLRGRR
jgi:23S rRNA (adenine-N6)-dimethyltransferase